MKKIALATSRKFGVLTDDDQLLIEPLKRQDIQAKPAVWSDSAVGWLECDAVIIRSCWDYHLCLPEFFAWIAALEAAGVRLLNSPETIRWNANKTYLRDLERRGIPIVPTFWPEKRVNLTEVLRTRGWEHAVVKPRVSATAHRTMLISAEDAEQGQALLDDLLAGPGVMVQRFMDTIQTEGEWSLIFFAGKFSHAVIKTPKAGDFRVQHDFGGAERRAEPSCEILESAKKAIKVLDSVPLYARVDGVESDGQFLLMELELIEPALFLGMSPEAPGCFARAILQSLRRAD